MYRAALPLLIAALILLNIFFADSDRQIGVVNRFSQENQGSAATAEIDGAQKGPDRDVQASGVRRDGARYWSDLGLVYTLGDSLWMDGRNISDSGVIHTFPILNDSPKVITITDVRTSCACAKASLSTLELRPGQETRVSLSVSHEKLSGGPKTFWAFLTTDSDEVWKCGISAHIERAVRWPAESVLFGAFRGREKMERQIDLVLSRPPFIDDLTFVRCDSSSPYVTVRPVATERSVVDQGVEQTIVTFSVAVSLPAKHPCQVYDAYLTAVYQSGRNEYESMMRVTFEKTTSFEVRPGRILLSGSPSDAEPLNLTVKHRDGSTFRILSVSSPGRVRISTPTPTDAASVHDLELTILPADKTDAGVDELIIHTDVLHEEELSIPLVSLPGRR